MKEEKIDQKVTATRFFYEFNIILVLLIAGLERSKRQTRRETGAQSHGSARLMRTVRQTARPPKFFCSAVLCLKKGGALLKSKPFLNRSYLRLLKNNEIQ